MVRPGAPSAQSPGFCLSPEPPQVQHKHFLPSWRVWKLFLFPSRNPTPNHPQSSSIRRAGNWVPQQQRRPATHTHTPHAGVGVWHRTPVSGRWLPNAFLGVLPEHLSSQCPGSPFSVSRPASPSYSEVAVWRQAVGEARRVEAGAEVGSSSSLL